MSTSFCKTCEKPVDDWVRYCDDCKPVQQAKTSPCKECGKFTQYEAEWIELLGRYEPPMCDDCQCGQDMPSYQYHETMAYRYEAAHAEKMRLKS